MCESRCSRCNASSDAEQVHLCFSLRTAIQTRFIDAVRFHEVLSRCGLVVTVAVTGCRLGIQKLSSVKSRSAAQNLYIIPTVAKPDCVKPWDMLSCVHNDDYGVTQHGHQKGCASFPNAESHKRPALCSPRAL